MNYNDTFITDNSAQKNSGYLPRTIDVNTVINNDQMNMHKSSGIDKKRVKPFLKWAGGKSQLLDEIRKRLPNEFGTKITKYAEPFVGGGAVLFDVISKYNLEDVYISDINAELINCYKSIKYNVYKLIDMLMQEEYLILNDELRKEYYYRKREVFNELISNESKEYSLTKASLFIFLNRTCFNGLYRVNSRGHFNVPIGSYKKPLICDEENLIYISEKLQNVNIICGDYRQSVNFIDGKTLVYFDPPYRPLTETSSFTSYTQDGFTDEAQKQLLEFVEQANMLGAKIIVSNSDPKNYDPEDNFFDNLYKGYKVERVQATRMINSNGESRGKISELLIRNYCNEEKNMKRDFDKWISKFKYSISGYDYYVNFKKVIDNVDKIRIELNILNSLIGSKNIENEFKDIVLKYPETLKCIPILLAVRGYEIYAQDNDGEFLYNFDRMNYSVDEYIVFMKKTGLFGLISEHLVNNLVDYVLGFETGLDSNGRKNRGGHQMENLVERFIKKAGFKRDNNYFKEMYLDDIETKWKINLSALSNKGKTRKRFDFVIKTDNMIYAIETNFYGGTNGGSKLNETARSYKMLSQESDTVDGFKFVWFTDGTAWKSARGNLRETFDVMETIYSIDDIENGIMNKLFI